MIGCFKFLEGYYLLFATKKRLQGSVCGRTSFSGHLLAPTAADNILSRKRDISAGEKIYGIGSIGLVSLANPSVADEEFSVVPYFYALCITN